MLRLLCVAAGSVLFATGLIAQGLDPVGSPFQVNSYVTDRQSNSVIASAPDGSFWVVWQSEGSAGSDTDGRSVAAQRYFSNGTPAGGELQVNSLTTGNQTFGDASVDGEGRLVVSWTHSDVAGGDGDGASVRGRRFSSDGSAVASEFQINTVTTGNQVRPKVASNRDGSFVVVWKSVQLFGQRFGSDGSPAGGEIQVNGTSFEPELINFEHDVVPLPDGFAVVWTEYTPADFMWAVRGRRFDAAGSPVGDEFVPRQSSDGPGTRPLSVTADADSRGRFHVVWHEEAIPVPVEPVWVRSYDRNAQPLTDAVRIDEANEGLSTKPGIGASEDGSFVVSWSQNDFYGPSADGAYGGAVIAKMFAPDGNVSVDDFVVNTYTANAQDQPSVEVDQKGHVIISWKSEGSDGTDQDLTSIQAQRFVNPTHIFIDGFESGDTSAWN